MGLFLARPGPFLSVLRHCQDSRKPFLGSFLRLHASLFQTVSERFRSLSRPYLKLSSYCKAFRRLIEAFTFLRQFVPSLVYSLLFPLKFSTATRKLSCIPIGCNLTSTLPANLSTLSCTLLLMELRCGGAL